MKILVVLSIFLVNSQAFSVTTRSTTSRPAAALRQLYATSDHAPYPIMSKREYTQDQLKSALESLLSDSHNPAFDARHIHGFGVEEHELSMLQTITATVMLDYLAHMVSRRRKRDWHVWRLAIIVDPEHR